ncbi:hypothetical protein LSUE1_G005567 [Lachnellula suecica]|uniref:Uncharacterized protein n=1 Tax=Lachnellula suecica TaxID=602035 RepID=A0A8T9CCC6_9HELO|nr:hypothetical protein LSUE1_G005567 [Lachnellula suecica]
MTARHDLASPPHAKLQHRNEISATSTRLIMNNTPQALALAQAPAVPAPALASQIPQPNALPNSDADSDSLWSVSTWDYDPSDDSDEEAWPPQEDEGCLDEWYWEEEASANKWLARFPGGTPALYPHLFVAKSTPTHSPDRAGTLLRLPPEIRNRIYKHYFDQADEVKHYTENYDPFYNHDGKAMQRIVLSILVIDIAVANLATAEI